MKKRAFKKLSAILAVVIIIVAIAPMSAQAAVGDTFIVDNIGYRVDVEASGSNPGEALVTKYNAAGGDVVIPATVTNALNGNKYTVTCIFESAFETKSITSVKIPSTVEIISISAFQGCASLTNVVFEPGSKLTNISSDAFRSCESLESINLPDGLEQIYARAFYDCESLESVDIPESVYEIASNAFEGCSNLKEIIFNSPSAPSIGGSIFDRISTTGKIYYPENGSMSGYDDAFFDDLFNRSFPSGWKIIEGRPPAPVPPTSSGAIITPVNLIADVPKADVPGFGREFSVSGEITNAPGVSESVMLNANSLSPEFTSNKAANAAYSDALLHGQPVAFNALEVVDAASGQAYVLPEGAEVELKFGLGKAYADKAVTISQYDEAGKLIKRFNVTCDGDGSAVINASGLGMFVITREWL